MRSPLRSPAQVEGPQGVLPQAEKNLESPSSTRLEARFHYYDLKAMTNLDSELKSRDITLPRKVRIVKAKVFPVVMYGCERRTIKKAEH